MLDSLLSSNNTTETLTFSSTIIIIGAALVLGLFISAIYMLTYKKEGYSSNFIISLIMLPAIIAMIILLVGSNVARAFSLAGAFSLIRFRSSSIDSKDISYVFFTLGIGLSCGMGFIGYATVFAIILCGAMWLLTKLQFGKPKLSPISLKILMPEDIDFHGIFDEILNQYTVNNKLIKVRTVEFGSVFELTYELLLKDVTQSKRFIDELRCKNGNLNIILSIHEIDKTEVL